MGTNRKTFVIVGAGLAGAKAAETMRQEGFDGPIVLVGDEHDRPYDRPPLSKDYLQGKLEREAIFVHPEDWYARHDVDLLLATTVSGVDRDARVVVTDAGERVGYAKLLLATGSRPRRLDVPGGDLDGVFYLRRVADAEAIRNTLASAGHLVVIGAGWIGLETAAAARLAGVEVTVLEVAALPLVGVLGPEVARIYADEHRRHGVEFRFGAHVAEIVASGRAVAGVRLDDGTVIDADAVVVGVGIRPNTELAEAAGLAIDDGILADAHLRTSDPDIFAAGDVASSYYPWLGLHLRLEHWAAALNQGPVAALNMMDRETAYDHVPYFFSDQYEMGMEYSGFVNRGRYDEVLIRGDVDGREFIAFWLRGGRAVAAMNVNVWDVTEDVQSLIRSGRVLDRTQLVDPSVPLSELRAAS